MNEKYILELDIGGTNPRIAMIQIKGDNNFKILKISEAKSNSNLIIPIINNFLEECGQSGWTTNTAIISVAGPIENNCCYNPTHAKFPIIDTEIIKNTYLSNILVINDFAAIGYAISVIKNPDIDKRFKKITPNVKFNLNGPRAIIGPGTGLGISYLTNSNNQYFVHESEGGHATFYLNSKYDLLLEFIKKKNNYAQIEMENLVSGNAIKDITEFLISNPNNNFELIQNNKSIKKNINDIEILDIIKNETLSNTNSIDAAKYISENIENNYNANLAMNLFITFLGSAAQNLALHANSTGGLFIGGGIAPKNLHLFETGNFQKSFYNNSNSNICKLLNKIPIYVILDYDITFYGCAIIGINKFNDLIK